MNMFKNNGGFTLVELIVVIAILAILAGVAVPAYSGYISKANEASDLTQLDSLKTAAIFSVLEDQPDANVTTITYNEKTGVVTVNVEGATDALTVTGDVTTLMGGTLPEFKSNNDLAVLDLTDASPKWALSEQAAE